MEEETEMVKVVMLQTGDGTMVILTSHSSPTDEALIAKLVSKGIEKFIAHEIPIELAKERYGHHFNAVADDLRETGDIRVLDYSGGRAFKLFKFRELGPAIEYEDGEVITRRS
ncbi:MAG: hypothetical protein JNM75_02145 [Rhodospirillales bacterium]|nr:hypothetical protein [Rhodospirillales bacterium]